MSVTAAVLRDPHSPYEMVEVELDGPRPGEVVVEMVASGMCHTDQSMRAPFRDIAFPVVLGHEGAGRISEVGAGVDLAVGQPVVLSFQSCGACGRCRGGHPAYCDLGISRNFATRRDDGSTGFAAGGEVIGSHFFGQSSFATHAVVDASSVVVVDDDCPLEIAGPLGCGVQTGAGGVLNVLQPAPRESFAVIGSGAVGLSALMAAVMVGCDPVIAVDLHTHRLELATELGATHVVAGDGGIAEAFTNITSGRGVDHVFDTTGIGSVVTEAVTALAPGGTLATVAAHGEAPMAEVSLRTLLPGRSLRGVVEGDSVPQVFIPDLLAHHRAGRFPFDRLITAYPFAAINEAEAASASGEVIKPVLVMADA